MSYVICSCSSVDCQLNGCRISRDAQRRVLDLLKPSSWPPTPWPREAISPAPYSPPGCICPPTSEKTCEARYCPRKDHLATAAGST